VFLNSCGFIVDNIWRRFHILTCIRLIYYLVFKRNWNITLREILHPRSRTFRKSNQQDRCDIEFGEVATSSNMRNTMEYYVSLKCTDNLANANAKIGVRVFKKTSLTILLNSRQLNQLSMRNQCGTEIHYS
jgi:hypothetical protein